MFQMVRCAQTAGMDRKKCLPHGIPASIMIAMSDSSRKSFFPFFLLTALAFAFPLAAIAAEEDHQPVPVPTADRSFQFEVQHAIDRGLLWLRLNRHAEGWWSTPDQPAVTALALLAIQSDPSAADRESSPAWLETSYDYLMHSRQEDGGIYRKGLVTYNTALGMLALIAARQPDYEPIIRRARAFLIGLQSDFNEKGKADSPFDGGIGYGGSYEHSDMGNTLQALEALYYSRHLSGDKSTSNTQDLDWGAAIHFLENCQNLPAYNEQPWASDDPANKGGFVYYPGLSKAGAATNSATGRVALRSYGSISYAGMLSYIYAQLPKEDPRIQAVLEWLRGNYTLEENPGMGAQGLFYYFHTMSKALSIYGMDKLYLADGTEIDWKNQLAMRMINLQKPDGSWLNDQHGRWWENDPALVTSYAVLTLERILNAPEGL